MFGVGLCGRRSTRLARRAATLVLAGSLFFNVSVVAANETGRVSPLSEAERLDLSKVRADPEPEQITRNVHFIVSDETKHYLFREPIENAGGAFIGVGTNQNFSLAGWAKPEILVLLDFDKVVVNLHLVYRAVFLEAKTPAAFLALWSEEKRAELQALVKRTYAESKSKRWRATSAIRWARKTVYRKLNFVNAFYAKKGQKHYLSDQAQYDYVRSLFQTGRVLMIRGDLTAKRTMRDLAAVFEKHNRKLRVLYISNCEQYFKYDRQYRRNITRMPTDEKSMVLHTRAWREWQRDGKGPLHYLFMPQTYENFRLWLANPRIKDIRQLVPREQLKPENEIFEIKHTPPERRRRKKREKKGDA